MKEIKTNTSKARPEIKAQHREFIRHYLSGNTRFNARQAAIKAGYKASSAGTIGGQILGRPEVKAEIDRIQEHQVEDVQLDYCEFINVCSERTRAGGRDATTWAALLAKAKGWGLENTRILHDQLPPPSLVLPSMVGIKGQDVATQALTEAHPVIEAEVRELAPQPEGVDNNQTAESKDTQGVAVEDVVNVESKQL